MIEKANKKGSTLRRIHKTAGRRRKENSAAPGLTDRALRYRANANPPDGPELCHYCGSDGRVDVEHVDGKEENTAPGNLAYACRSCNATKGAFFAREGIGRLTRQYNPHQGATNARQYIAAVAGLMGRRNPAGGELVPAPRAIATVQATRPATRARFAAGFRRQLFDLVQRNPAPTVPTFEQYAWAVTQGPDASHKKSGAHDEAGAIIHATPPTVRSEYARRLASGRRRRRDEVPF